MFKESIHLELKKEYVKDILKTVVAFANTSGGKIYIGIDDEGKVLGVERLDTDILKLSNSIRDSIKPDITLFTSIFVEKIDSKDVIVVDVQKGASSPYYLADKGLRPSGVYVRHGASSVPATDAAILKMIRDTDGDNFEELRSLNQNLDFDFLKKEFEDANIKLEYSQMRTFNIIDEDGLYTNLGLLLSEQCPHTIKAAVFEGSTKEIFKDRFEFSGSLLKQMKDVYSFLNRYNRTNSEITGLKRTDTREYPEIAIREALLNSIVHKEYSYSSSTLISIFDDKIEIVTIGGLTKGLSEDDIMLGVSILRNRNLANIFYRLKLIEAYGTGIPKIIESYNEYNVKPKIEISSNAFKITLPNTLKEKSSSKFENNLSDKEYLIVNMLKENEYIKRTDIEKNLSVSSSMAIKLLRNMVENSIIEKLGKGKNVIYKLK
ncbi:ATP-dependent DNA helicase RecG [Acetoanaerobium pronyense]|uniref:ATP-dependent DNA helicase RecG n=1 Tax=Acetoanaerobium pronyense TaxID=1482736 RepID=A0ABS4KHJ7_9FIRM|nr:RNA-binding domain-containing protein [Acetoanaerobium pronyense]MBP2027234.1 ATP-dependent DNA helicase RecG [Acetoanaerobium pronyense]